LTAKAESSRGVERLLIVRLSSMGDVIHTLPAAQALREAFPHAMIGWLIEERWAELLCAPGTSRRGPRSPQRPLVDWVHSVNLRTWRRSLFTAPAVQQIAKIWSDVRSTCYDVAVDLQGAIRSAVLAKWSGADAVYGSSEPRESPASLFYSRSVVAQGTHVIDQNLSVAAALIGRNVNLPRVDFPRDVAAEEAICRKLGQFGTHEYAILNPGAGWGAKRWPAERFGEVARQLACDGICSVVNSGPGEERLAEAVVASSAGAAKSMKLSISELIALTRRAKLFIGGDTGPMHLAAALHIPVVAIFGPTNPARNGPYGTRGVVLRNPASSTTLARGSQPDEPMLQITTHAVVESARILLSQQMAEGNHG
jgi:heptosyltransferase I